MRNQMDDKILECIHARRDGASSGDILTELGGDVSRHTLRDRLNALIRTGQLRRVGVRRWARYSPAGADTTISTRSKHRESASPASRSRTEEQVKTYIEKPVSERRAVGYSFGFLDDYQTGKTCYLNESELRHLHDIGTQEHPEAPAGAFIKSIYRKLLIDLAWNSSRLEGNTYSLRETERLIEFDETADDRQQVETQMILNHKHAIDYMATNVNSIAIDGLTVKRLHALLAQDLMDNRNAVGALRKIGVGIGESAYTPLDNPHQIDECFDRIMAKASGIADPFEQAFFLMVHLPYLQPFEDVNKRTSRLALNIPLIKNNLVPLSFVGVNEHTYVQAIMGVYELNEIVLLKDLFIWAYARSVERYRRVNSQVGTPDRFRLAYRPELVELVALLVREKVRREHALERMDQWTDGRIAPNDLKDFKLHAERDLTALRRETAIFYDLTDAEFTAWREIWGDV